MKNTSKNTEITAIFKAGIIAGLTAACGFYCAFGAKQDYPHDYSGKESPDGNFTIWALSDIQPRKMEECNYFETAVLDVNQNIPSANIALVAGDIIHWSKSEKYFKCYNDSKEKSYIAHWYEIAGNHDHKDFENYRKYINMPLHYSVQAGNILIILLSDENKNAETVISDSAFNWWKELVVNNQDKIIITVTHGYLAHSGLFGAFVSSRNIRNSERFADVLKKYRIDIWLCGHTHVPHWINTRVKQKKNLGGALFVNVSAVRGNIFKNPESVFLFFKDGRDSVLIRSRDHEKRKFNKFLDIQLKLSRPFQRGNGAPVMRPME